MFNILFWTCFVTANLIRCTKSCADGECKNVNQCESLSEMIHKQRKSADEWNLLTKLGCGFENDIPKICCPIKAPEVSNACHTPYGLAGKCINIAECRPAVAVLARRDHSTEDRTYWEKSKCPGPPNTFYVCCPPMPPPEPSTVLSPVPASGPCKWTDPPSSFPASSQHKKCSPKALPVDVTSGCCGPPNSNQNRIHGGNSTGIYQYPWMALIEYRIRSDSVNIALHCGGSLISGRYVLTAAHCVDKQGLVPKNVRLGEYDTSNCGADCEEVDQDTRDCNDAPVRIPIEGFIKHELYDKTDLHKNDIALIRLAQMAPITTFIAPICLPTVDAFYLPQHAPLYVAGWGADSNNTSSTSLKQHVEIPYVQSNVCRRRASLRRLGEGQICAGGEPGKDSCSGDSGGPLMYVRMTAEELRYELVGIVSFGEKPCGARMPAVYTKVRHYLNWIKFNTHE